VFTIEAFVDAFTLEPTGTDRYLAQNLQLGHAVVFGGQIIGQSLLAGLAGHEGKTVKTVHTVFARGASPDAPLELTVDRMHAGRAVASSSVTVSQGDTLCSRSVVLLTAAEPDVIRHADGPPRRSKPDDVAAHVRQTDAFEVGVVGDVDINDPDQVGPAELDVWVRFNGAPDDPGVNQALLAFANEGFLIGTAMRPHPGVGQSQAHKTLSTGVLGHTLTFHEAYRAGEWHLLAQQSSYAGHGRSYGVGNVFDADGELVASFVQDAMIRARAEGPGKL
jgi:acyl-CoA thioesterase II